MPSSLFTQQDGGNTILQTMSQLKGMGDINAACSFLDNAGITRTLPNGQTVTAGQFVQMMQGKTPEQAAGEMGMDPSLLRRFM